MPAPPVAPEDKELLKQLAKLGALHEYVLISSSEFALKLGISQQTSSRKILELLDAELILRRMTPRRQHIRLSASGVDVLRREFADYRQLFSGGEKLSIRGKVVTGLGEGRYYISREGYRKAFGRLLGFDPFPGTLNVEVDPLDREKVAELKDMDGLMIEEFQSEGRTFGAVKCFRAQLRLHPSQAAIEAAAIFPLRSHHTHVLELVSPHGLREKLSLADGTEVVVTLDVSASLSSAG